MFTTAANSVIPNMPRLEMLKVPPSRSWGEGLPARARSISCRDSIEIWTRSLASTSFRTGTTRPFGWATAKPMLIRRLTSMWSPPQEALTPGKRRSASALARMTRSEIVSFSAPVTVSRICFWIRTASSIRASVVR